MKSFYIYAIVFVVMLFVILLQFNMFNIITLLGTAPNLGVVFIVAIGLLTGKERGASYGFVYGLILDIIEGRMLGLYTLLYLILGYVVGRIGKDFSRENHTTFVAMVGICTVVFEGFAFLMGIVFNHFSITFLYFCWELAKEVVYNMLIAIIVFKFLYGLCDLLSRTKSNYYLL